MVKEKPFIQIKISRFIIRFFYKKDPMLYTWHKDKTHRDIFFISLGEWYIQSNNKLPDKIMSFIWYSINSNVYHRLIHKKGVLISLIYENS